MALTKRQIEEHDEQINHKYEDWAETTERLMQDEYIMEQMKEPFNKSSETDFEKFCEENLPIIFPDEYGND